MEREITRFPYKEVYPSILADLIEELETKLGYPIDYTSACFLLAFGVAIGNTTHVKFKASFIENAALYCVLVGKPARGKTAPLNYCLKSINNRNKKLYNEFLKAKKDYEANKARKDAGEEVEPMEFPTLKICALNDITLETMLQCMSNNQRGILVFHDELKGLIANFNRYNKGSDTETFLTMWSHTPISVTRKSSGHFQIDAPFCSIIGGTQPDVLKDMFGKQENGFTDRWLFVLLLDNNIAEWTDLEVDKAKEEKVEAAFELLFNLPEIIGEDGCIIPNVLEFTKEARAMLIGWRNEVHREQAMADENETYVTAHLKMDIMVLRFALILEMMYWAFGEGNGSAVGVRAVEGAIKLVDYFKYQVQVLHQLSVDNDVRLLMGDAQAKLYAALPNYAFKTSDGIKIASRFEQSEWQFKRFLKKEKFFENKGFGQWRKTVIED